MLKSYHFLVASLIVSMQYDRVVRGLADATLVVVVMVLVVRELLVLEGMKCQESC